MEWASNILLISALGPLYLSAQKKKINIKAFHTVFISAELGTKVMKYRLPLISKLKVFPLIKSCTFVFCI